MVIYQAGKVNIKVWEDKTKGENGDITSKFFELENTSANAETKRNVIQFNEAEFLELKALIDRVESDRYKIVIKDTIK